jgi:hypothetical protein
MVLNGVMQIVKMRKRFGTTKGVTKIGLTNIARRIQMEVNSSIGIVDYLSPPGGGKTDWFMPVVLEGSGTKIKFYCKFDPQVQVGDRVLVSYGQERNGNATAFKVERPDKDVSDNKQPTSQPTSSDKEEGMIEVGLTGRITEALMRLFHEKGVEMKDPEGEVAKWIRIGVNGYRKHKKIADVQEAYPGTTVSDNDIDDEVPF